MSTFRFIEAVGQEFRFAVRMLRKSPGFSAIVVLSMALGIGVNTTMFSVINAVLLQTVPFPDPDGLVRLVRQRTGGDLTTPEYQFVKEDDRVFSSVAAYRGGGERRLEARGGQTWVTALTVTADLLRTLRNAAGFRSRIHGRRNSCWRSASSHHQRWGVALQLRC